MEAVLKKFKVYVKTVCAGPNFGPFPVSDPPGSKGAKGRIVDEATAKRLHEADALFLPPEEVVSSSETLTKQEDQQAQIDELKALVMKLTGGKSEKPEKVTNPPKS